MRRKRGETGGSCSNNPGKRARGMNMVVEWDRPEETDMGGT
jgi:hypothetical protein